MLYVEDFAVRSSIWFALIAYGAAILSLAFRYQSLARVAWSIGCLAYLVHVALAFEIHHDWSHGAAFQSTLERTESTTGFRTGFGLYLNYLFTLVWITDAVYWWLAGVTSYRDRPAWINLTLHGFFLFMIFNGAIVFTNGPARWLGIAVVSTAMLALWKIRTDADSSIAKAG
jgi:hypothetical protein